MHTRNKWVVAFCLCAGSLAGGVLLLADRDDPRAHRVSEPSLPIPDLEKDDHVLVVDVRCLPPDAQPAWSLAVRVDGGGTLERVGIGPQSTTIHGVKRGRHFIVLKAPGYTGAVERHESSEAVGPYVLTLVALGAVRGTVVDATTGVPVPKAAVQVSRAPGATPPVAATRGDGTPAESHPAVQTDESGAFVVADLPPGSGYSVRVYHQLFRPTIVRDIEIAPAATTHADVALEAGAYLTGRVTDYAAIPARRAKVHFLRRAGAGWLEEASTVTDDDGAFRSPSLTENARKMIKVWLRTGDVDEIAQAVVTTPHKGGLDVGTIAPTGAVVAVVIENAAPDRVYSLTISALEQEVPEPSRVERLLLFGDIPFSKEGVAQVAGIPIGSKVRCAVLDRARIVGRTEFEVAAVRGRHVVRVEEPQGPEVRPEKQRLTVRVVSDATEALVLIVNADGTVIDRSDATRDSPTSREWRAGFRVPPGHYAIYVVAAQLSDVQEIDVVSDDLEIEVTPSRPTQECRVRVVRDGDPVANAAVYLVGFGSSKKGVSPSPWARSDEEGRVLLTRLPHGVETVSVAILDGKGSGRRVILHVDRSNDVDIGASPDGK